MPLVSVRLSLRLHCVNNEILESLYRQIAPTSLCKRDLAFLRRSPDALIEHAYFLEFL